MVPLALFLVLFKMGVAETDNTKAIKPNIVKDACEGVRVVSLEIHGVYDQEFVKNRKRINATENITEYLSLLVAAAGHQHFGNISCTNISLVLTGASALENESNVLVLKEYGAVDVDPTLEKFRTYWWRHRGNWGNPDAGVLFTPRVLVNKSTACNDIRKQLTQRNSGYTRKHSLFSDLPPEYQAYCNLLQGAAYYKGICGNNSVAIVKDDGGTFRGTASLAKSIATLFGVGLDIFRTEKECNGSSRHYLTSAASQFTHSPDLSPCAKKELQDFIDCTSGTPLACWNDTAISAFISRYQTPHHFFEDNDFCSRYYFLDYKCPAESNISDFKECQRQCCRWDDDYEEHYVELAITTPYGKTCGKGGMCYGETCFE